MLLAAVASPAAAEDLHNYDCTLGPPQAVSTVKGEKVVRKVAMGNVSKETWKFSLSRSDRKMVIDWPESPMQLTGEGPLIQTGSSAYASFFFGKGPCLFTDGHCGASVQIAEQADRSLFIQVQPIAFTRFQDGSEGPFVAFIEGHCEAKEAKQ